MVLDYINLTHSTYHHANIATITAIVVVKESIFYSNILDMNTITPLNHHTVDFSYQYSYFRQNY